MRDRVEGLWTKNALALHEVCFVHCVKTAKQHRHEPYPDLRYGQKQLTTVQIHWCHYHQQHVFFVTEVAHIASQSITSEIRTQTIVWNDVM